MVLNAKSAAIASVEAVIEVSEAVFQAYLVAALAETTGAPNVACVVLSVNRVVPPGISTMPPDGDPV